MSGLLASSWHWLRRRHFGVYEVLALSRQAWTLSVTRDSSIVQHYKLGQQLSKRVSSQEDGPHGVSWQSANAGPVETV